MGSGASVLTLAEVSDDKRILPISLECLTAGKRLAEVWEAGTAPLIMGAGVGEAAREMARNDVDEVLWVDHPSLEGYHSELSSSAFLQVCEQLKPKQPVEEVAVGGC